MSSFYVDEVTPTLQTLHIYRYRSPFDLKKNAFYCEKWKMYSWSLGNYLKRIIQDIKYLDNIFKVLFIEYISSAVMLFDKSVWCTNLRHYIQDYSFSGYADIATSPQTSLTTKVPWQLFVAVARRHLPQPATFCSVKYCRYDRVLDCYQYIVL